MSSPDIHWWTKKKTRNSTHEYYGRHYDPAASEEQALDSFHRTVTARAFGVFNGLDWGLNRQPKEHSTDAQMIRDLSSRLKLNPAFPFRNISRFTGHHHSADLMSW